MYTIILITSDFTKAYDFMYLNLDDTVHTYAVRK
jgi:hypothetical protein